MIPDLIALGRRAVACPGWRDDLEAMLEDARPYREERERLIGQMVQARDSAIRALEAAPRRT
jgi:hypothetical protein